MVIGRGRVALANLTINWNRSDALICSNCFAIPQTSLVHSDGATIKNLQDASARFAGDSIH